MKPHLTAQPVPALEEEPWGFACLSAKGCHAPPTNSLPPLTPGSFVCTISFFKQLCICWHQENILHLHMYPSPFYKDDLNQDASRKEDEMSIFTKESKKMWFGGNAIIFDEMGEGQELSSINYCRYDFLIKSVGKAACSFCFYSVNSKVAKVI